MIDWLAGLFGDKSAKGQRKRAWWLVLFLTVAFAVIAYLWVGLRSSPIWWPYTRFEGIEGIDLSWLDWLFTGAMGTLIYLLWEIAQYYRNLNGQEGEDDQGEIDFVGNTPWYFVTALRGPVIVLVVMFIMTNVTLDTALTGADTSSSEAIGITIDLSNAGANLLALIAFTLGFFNRLPLHIFERLASRMFGSAFKRAYPEMNQEDEPGQQGPDGSGVQDGPDGNESKKEKKNKKGKNNR